MAEDAVLCRVTLSTSIFLTREELDNLSQEVYPRGRIVELLQNRETWDSRLDATAIEEQEERR